MTLIAASTLGDSFTGAYEQIEDIEVAETEQDGAWLMLVCNWRAIHIVPVLDQVCHTVEPGDDCICMPEVEAIGDGFMISHASLDGREKHEGTDGRET